MDVPYYRTSKHLEVAWQYFKCHRSGGTPTLDQTHLKAARLNITEEAADISALSLLLTYSLIPS